MTQEHEALKACPFCGVGGRFLTYENRKPDGSFGMSFDHKPECFFSVPYTTADDGDFITAWNTRPSPAPWGDVVEEERAHMQTIAERDVAETAIGAMYSAVTGKPAEWSNLFGYGDALEEVRDTLTATDRARELLRDIAQEVRDPDGAGTLPFEMLARIDTTLSQQPQVDTQEVPADDRLAAELRRLIDEATEGVLETAETSIVDAGEYVECPLCSGEGEVEQDAHYNNFDGVALGVQFYGIGKHFGAQERLWRFFMSNRETILAALRTDTQAPPPTDGLAGEPWELDDPDILDRLRDEGHFEAVEEIENLQARCRALAEGT